MQARSGVASVVALFLGACDGCSGGKAPPAGDRLADAAVFGTLPDGRAPTALAHVIDGGARARLPAGPPGCRIVSAENGPSPSDDATSWLTLAEKSQVAVKVTETGREIRFEGPGIVRPCVRSGNVDVAIVVTGTGAGLPSAGEGAGNDQWLSSPCGALRWSAGVHRMTASRDECTIQASAGTAHLWIPSDVHVTEEAPDGGAGDASTPAPAPADAGTAGPWRRIDARRALRLVFDGRPGRVAKAVDACERAARDAEEIARKIADGGGPLGDLAAAAIDARTIVRAACTVAAARVHASGDDPALFERTRRAEARALGPSTRADGDAGR
jgi:hypothetical protein